MDKSSPSPIITLFLYCVGLVIRIMLLNSSSFSKSLGNRIEISTPLSSWKRAVEGVTLWSHGTNPYDGDIFHESPLALVSYHYIFNHGKEWLSLIFSLCDLVTAAALSLAAKVYLNDFSKRKNISKTASASRLLLKSENINWVPLYVSAFYLLCPFSIASCCGKSTTVFQNMFLSLFILSTVIGKWHFASFLLSLLIYHSFYHLNLLVPLVMHIYQTNIEKHHKVKSISKSILTVITCFISLSLFIFYSYKITGSWQFLWATYGCILSVPDLVPNIGLFWYFFTEMFEHFRVFFLCTFQLNAFVYTAPLAIRLRKEPIFLLFIQLIIITIFKSYPSIGDIAFYFSLLPVWSHIFQLMRQKLIVCCIMASCTLLAPTLWYLWIYSGSANANFYFAITLAFNTGQVFLLTDVLSAYVKREYYLENGIKYNEDGSLVLMRLQ